jgi:hypothetical protein
MTASHKVRRRVSRTGVTGCYIVLVLVLVAIGVVVYLQSAAREQAWAAYLAALGRLKADPANPDLRQTTLALGRRYSNLTRNQRGVTVFDEVALMNDINAACAATSVATPQRTALPAAPKEPVEVRLARLAELRAKGVIDGFEYAEQRRRILAEV